jgi:cytochrome c oxidase assembly protein subunit 15
MPSAIPAQFSPWPHRLAVALALVTFPLIWVGGLVTTYKAGMAVPDWPGTYGYNLFRYPWQTWLAGPWDLFIEHGHRLLGATAGLVAVALVVVTWRSERRKWLVWACVAALGLVILQGVLGGLRVRMDERQIALLHACVGPLFFAYLAFLLVVMSRWWIAADSGATLEGKRFARLTVILLAASYAQLVLGAVLRHIPVAAGAGLFRAALLMHLILAAALFLIAALSLLRSWPLAVVDRWRGLAGFILLLVVIQIGLGGGTYVMKYAFPAWMLGFGFAAGYVVQERSLAQSLVTTAHVATGSLILFLAALQATHAARCFFQPAASPSRDHTWSRSASLTTIAFRNGRAAA